MDVDGWMVGWLIVNLAVDEVNGEWLPLVNGKCLMLCLG